MKGKLSLVLLAVLVMGTLGGCGGSTTTASYYYYPDWTPDGRIICVKKTVISTSGGSFVFPGNEDVHYYITTMSEEGTQEENVKEISGIDKVAMSPNGNFIAYVDGNFLRVISSLGAEIANVNSGAAIYSFDWSSNSLRIVYEGTKEAFVVDKEGSNKIVIAEYASSVAWRNGDFIILAKKETDSSSYETVTLNENNFSEEAKYFKVIGGEFSVSKVDTNEAIYRGANEQGINKFFINSPEADPILLIDRNDIWNIHLSPSGDKIVGTGDGYGTGLGAEIWLINIDGTGGTRIK